MYSSLCFCPLTHLQSENKNTVIEPVWSPHWRRVGSVLLCCTVNIKLISNIRNQAECCPMSHLQNRLFYLKRVIPLPKCLQTKASARIIWPHRNMHPHPVSDVGPVPPVTQTSVMNVILFESICTNRDDLNLHTYKVQLWSSTETYTCCVSLTNWREVFSVCEPQP